MFDRRDALEVVFGVGHAVPTSIIGPNDSAALLDVVRPYRQLKTTAPILTEACNLLDGDNRDRGSVMFRHIAASLLKGALKERRDDAVTVTRHPVFGRLGFADTSLMTAARKGALVVTTELPLFLELLRAGNRVVNFTHVQQQVWSRR